MSELRMTSLALAAGLLAYAAASGAFVGHVLAPPIRAAGQRRTWGRGLIRKGGAAMKRDLSPQMLAVLQSIANPHPDDEPFPPADTVKALMARGLVRCVSAREEATKVSRSSIDIIMAALGSQRLVATPAGLARLTDHPRTHTARTEEA